MGGFRPTWGIWSWGFCPVLTVPVLTRNRITDGAPSHNIQLSTRPGRQRTICLKTGKATNRGYGAPHHMCPCVGTYVHCAYVGLRKYVLRLHMGLNDECPECRTC